MTDDALLSAWLADDLDENEAAALEARLTADPALARRLDEVADAVARVRRLDAVEPPSGLEQRLRARVDRERAAADPVVSLDDERRRRSGWSQRVAKPLSAVAAIALLAVVGTSVVAVLGGGSGGGDSAGESAMESAGATAEEDSAARESQLSAPAAAAPPGPAVLEGPLPPPPSVTGSAAEAEEESAEAASETEADVESGSESSADEGGGAGGGAEAPPASADDASGLLTVPEIEAVRGLTLEEAGARAEEHRAAIAAAPPFSTGARPDACLDTVTADAQGPLVPVRVQATTLDGVPALAYVLVGASPESDVLDRVEVWITDPETCVTRSFLQG